MTRQARAFWFNGSGKSEIRSVTLPASAEGEALVRTLFTGVSRGTEALVFRGEVPENQYEVMRAPFQEGDFPWPVKYGYLNVGVVETGRLTGRTVFCLYPHQTHYVVPESALTLVPDTVPPERAVLAGTVETAVNAVWDAKPLIGDRIAVVGGGMVGASVAAVLAKFPGARVQLVDADPGRAAIADRLGVGFADPKAALGSCDLVVHASASEAGLETALGLLAPEGTVIELSWYGDRRISVPLGEFFHSRRLTVRSSQVGTVARPDRTYADRMALALDLLADPVFDTLVTGESPFDELPSVLPRLASGELPALCHRIDYRREHASS
ncbi:Threonine dehydrogenase [Amycolatopsis xylanica]|uniref:Threonine dehydrogenase n=1 Tax=Amycolatopsis xylanica TaxID=589385 RepID=A0A1H2S847_9PSEU|nr:zinc-binding alcohol dehydrogenase [Amycolatopsis xylanica]SDW27139.1 Threonine dehydrogenase [Amycolatopsis xylanica]